MTTRPLPSEEFPLAVHFDILRRFMAVSRNGAESVEAGSVEGGGLPTGAASRNAEFLSDLGFLVEEAPGKFKPTPVAMQFLNTQASDEQRGRKVLRSLIAKGWFARAAVAFFQSNPNARTAQLADALAREAGTSTTEAGGAIAVVVEYLTYTGLVPPDREEIPPESQERPSPASASPRTASRAAKPVPSTASGSLPWKAMRTDDFDLKIRPAPGAVRRLRKYLDLLEEELADAGEERPSR